MPTKKKTPTEFPRIVESYPSNTRKKWLQAKNSNSRKAAIRAMCLMCLGGSAKEVANCTADYCPLYKFRITG